MPCGKSACGCSRCGWSKLLDTRTVAAHILRFGSHVVAVDNSEPDIPSSEPDAPVEEPASHVPDSFDVGQSGDDDDESLIFDNDLISNDLDPDAETDTRAGNSHETNSSGDESEIETDEEASGCETDENENDSEWNIRCRYNKAIYESGIAVEKLSSNSDLTVLQALALNFHFFTSHPSISKSCFSHHLKIQNSISNDVLLPSSYYEAKQLIKPYLVPKIRFDVCPNDCILYRKSEEYDYSLLQYCAVCNEARYNIGSNGQQYPKRKFIYIPLGPRIARMYGDANLAQIIQSHSTHMGLDNGSDEMWDIHDSPQWKSLYGENGFFENDSMGSYGLSYALELDGVNPYHNIGVIYSMTPIMLTLLNLPRHIRNCFGSIQLVGIIPGKGHGKSECSNVQPFLDVLVDELLSLTGSTAYYGYTGAPTTVKIKLLLHILDYPGLSKLFNQHGSGSLQGCHWCWIQGVHIKELDKVVYLSNRSYLDPHDSIRKDKSNFMVKSEDKSEPPKSRSMDSEMGYRYAFDKAENKTKANAVARATGSKGIYSLCRLPGHDRMNQSLPDACHTVKDVIHNIMKLITGKSNINKIANAEKVYDRLSTSCGEVVTVPKRRCGAESARNFSYVLTKHELDQADKRACSLRVPSGFGLKPAPFISHPGSLKSHDWKQLATQGIIRYCLRDCLNTTQRNSLFLFLDCLSRLCSESQKASKLPQLEKDLNKALALLERDFPLHLQNITTHVLHHIISGIQRYGPVYGTWMYVFERFNSWLCQRALNKRHPEATAIETYIIYDWCQFMLSSGKMPNSCISLGNDTDGTTFEAIKSPDVANLTGNYENSVKLKASDLKILHKLHGCGLSDFTDASTSEYYKHTSIHNKTGREICTQVM